MCQDSKQQWQLQTIVVIKHESLGPARQFVTIAESLHESHDTTVAALDYGTFRSSNRPGGILYALSKMIHTIRSRFSDYGLQDYYWRTTNEIVTHLRSSSGTQPASKTQSTTARPLFSAESRPADVNNGRIWPCSPSITDIIYINTKISIFGDLRPKTGLSELFGPKIQPEGPDFFEGRSLFFKNLPLFSFFQYIYIGVTTGRAMTTTTATTNPSLAAMLQMPGDVLTPTQWVGLWTICFPLPLFFCFGNDESLVAIKTPSPQTGLKGFLVFFLHDYGQPHPRSKREWSLWRGFLYI